MQPDISRFSICREPSNDEKRRSEAVDIMLLLLRLDGLIELNDVKFGQDPPDFIFHCNQKQIGVELTKLNPKIFESGGYSKRAKFKLFKAEIEKISSGEETFPWGTFTFRESLDALNKHLLEKQKKADPWHHLFPERWLLMHTASGSPFCEIVASRQNMQIDTAPGTEEALSDYLAQITYGISQRCIGKKPFDYIILFFRENFLAFPTSASNPYHLPIPSDEILQRGASVPDSFLDRKRRNETTIRTQTFKSLK
jgi:hypothetical protein